MSSLITGEILMTIGSSGHESAPISEVAAEHARILDALRKREVEKASAHLLVHLDAAHKRLRGAFPEH